MRASSLAVRFACSFDGRNTQRKQRDFDARKANSRQRALSCRRFGRLEAANEPQQKRCLQTQTEKSETLFFESLFGVGSFAQSKSSGNSRANSRILLCLSCQPIATQLQLQMQMQIQMQIDANRNPGKRENKPKVASTSGRCLLQFEFSLPQSKQAQFARRHKSNKKTKQTRRKFNKLCAVFASLLRESANKNKATKTPTFGSASEAQIIAC